MNLEEAILGKIDTNFFRLANDSSDIQPKTSVNLTNKRFSERIKKFNTGLNNRLSIKGKSIMLD